MSNMRYIDKVSPDSPRLWGRIPSLKASEEAALWTEYKKSESTKRKDEIKERIINAHLKMCAYSASKYQRGSALFDDLCMAGVVGLFKAFDKFEPEKGYRFSTYAGWWISNGIVTELKREKGLGSTQFEKWVMSREFRLAFEKAQYSGPNVSLDDAIYEMAEYAMKNGKVANKSIADDIGLVADAIRYVFVKRLDRLSLDQPISNGEGDMTIGDMVMSDAPNPEESCADGQAKKLASVFFEVARDRFLNSDNKRLKDKKRNWHIFASRDLADEDESLTLQDLADKYGLTRQRVQQIHAQVKKYIEESRYSIQEEAQEHMRELDL